MIKLLLQPNDISSITGLGGNIDIDSMKPSINVAQTIHLKKMLGEDLYNKILAGNLSGDYQIILDNYVVYFLAFYSSSLYLSLNTIKTANNGSFKSGGANGDVLPTPTEVNLLSRTYENIAMSYEKAFRDFMVGKSIPEYAVEKTSTKRLINFY